MKRIIIAIVAVLLTFLATTFAVVAILLNSDKILSSFSIISVDNVSTTFVVRYEKVKAAAYYDLIVYNDRNVQIYSKTFTNTTANIELTMLEYNAEYKLVIYAYDKLGDSITVVNPYKFKYNEPSFSQDNSLVLTDGEDYELLIDGDLNKKDYRIRLMDNGVKIKEEKLGSNEYIIKSSYFTGLEQKLDVAIIDGLTVVSEISLYNKMSPVGALKITSPQNGDILDYNDVVFTYEGGENATEYVVQIYQDKKIIRETTVRRNRCVISAAMFEKSQNYKIRISALYGDYEKYAKYAEIEFTMNEKDTLKPAYMNLSSKYVKAGTAVVLSNPNPDGTIYYTINGEDPVTHGIKYTEPIVVNNKLNLKAVIMEPKKNNSVVSDFEINIGTKKAYSVYLSPSNQSGNLGVSKVGYTNEMKEMNDLTNYVEKRLKEYGVKVYRNSPHGNINLWTSDSKYYGVDLHLAIHSNASINHNQYGIETWINEQTSKTYSLANLLQDNLMNIYYNDNPLGNRGVKYANGSLGECNDLYLPFGILVEIGHHDHEMDAAWIMQNKALIGNAVADTILKYFGII